MLRFFEKLLTKIVSLFFKQRFDREKYHFNFSEVWFSPWDKDERFNPVVTGLPIGGISGTLRKRFLTTAPNAVGLVKAKTGTLNGTTNLAGYVESGDREYAFVIIADRLPRGSSAANRAKATVDKTLGKVASPLLPLLPVENLEEVLSSDTPL
jgi:hypothetical protein